MSLSGSLAEARELYTILGDIQDKIKGINAAVGTSTTTEASHKLLETRVTAAELYFITRRLISNLRRIGLGEDAAQWLATIQHLITSVRMLQLAMHYFEIATGPVGWAMFGVTFFASVLTFGDYQDNLNGVMQ